MQRHPLIQILAYLQFDAEHGGKIRQYINLKPEPLLPTAQKFFNVPSFTHQTEGLVRHAELWEEMKALSELVTDLWINQPVSKGGSSGWHLRLRCQKLLRH